MWSVVVKVVFPHLSSRNSRSSGSSVPKVVSLIAVIVRSAVPVVVNLTSQFPPTIGYDCTFKIVKVISTSNSCSDSCGIVHSIVSINSLLFVSNSCTLNSGLFTMLTFVPLIFQYSLTCSGFTSGICVVVLTFL